MKMRLNTTCAIAIIPINAVARLIVLVIYRFTVVAQTPFMVRVLQRHFNVETHRPATA